MNNEDLKPIGTDLHKLADEQFKQSLSIPELKKIEGIDERPAGETMDSSTSLLDDLALYFRVRLVRLIGDEQAGKATELLPFNPLKLASFATGWWKPVLAVIVGIGLLVALYLKKK